MLWRVSYRLLAQIRTNSVYTGYLDVDGGAKHLFFYFFESRRDPETGTLTPGFCTYQNHLHTYNLADIYMFMF